MIAAVVVGLAALLWYAWLARAGLMVTRIYQIEEYETPRLLAWSRQRAWLWPHAALVGAALAVVLALSALALPADTRAAGLGLGWLAGAVALHLLWRELAAKKALVFTPRVRRMLGAAALLAFLVTAGLAALVAHVPVALGIVLVGLLCLAAPALVPYVVILGNVAMAPVEARVRRGFLQRARVRIQEYQPTTIAIAGSYGKTSTKHIVAHLLAPQTATLATPKSFNTLMGVTRTINEHLQPIHRAFVVEMDAYGAGEIAAMCRLVEPQIGVITSLGSQHLERFGTVDAIGDALYELVDALPSGAPVVMYSGDRASARLAERALSTGRRVVRYGLADDVAGPCDVTAMDVTVDEHATHFTWRWPAQGLECRVSIPLLGRHNILNVSAALAVVHLMGLSVPAAVVAAAGLEPVPHRLQLMPGTGGVTIIDDSYNANPVGIHNGLDVLAQMRGQGKILVTPGLVELGPIEEAENRELGRHAARVCRAVILVGAQQTRPIQAGLQDGGMPAERIHVVETLEEVTATLGRITAAGDVVLFANDLPDSYLALA